MADATPPDGVYDIVLGDLPSSTDGGASDRGLVVLKYNTQAVGSAGTGSLSQNDHSGDALLTWGTVPGATRQFKGKRADGRATDCLLVFNPESNASTANWTLEQQPQIFQFQYSAQSMRSSLAASSGRSATAPPSATSTQDRIEVPGKTRTPQPAKRSPLMQPKPKSSLPALPSTAKHDSTIDIEDDFIEVDPTSARGGQRQREFGRTAFTGQASSVYVPVTVSSADTRGLEADSMEMSGYLSATSSEDEGGRPPPIRPSSAPSNLLAVAPQPPIPLPVVDSNATAGQNGHRRTLSSSSGSYTSGSSSSASSTSGSDSGSESSSSFDSDDETPNKQPSAPAATATVGAVQGDAEDDDDLGLDDLEAEIAAAMQGASADAPPSGDEMDWIENELEQELA